ncbi:MAG: hypothetical protein JRD89_01395 [Deltaproteobacteria bacterium]|nr:hypothetical protein [Deltaproteobacteria bacterium]
MKTLTLKGALLILAGFSIPSIALMVSAANVGDMIYTKKLPEVELGTITGGVAKAVECVGYTHPETLPGGILTYRVIRYEKGSMADGTEQKTATAEARAAQYLAGNRHVSTAETYPEPLKRRPVLWQAGQCWIEYLTLVHGIPPGEAPRAVAIRKEGAAYYSIVVVKVVNDSATFLQDVENGLVIQALDQVE